MNISSQLLTDIIPSAPVYISHLHLVLGDGRASVVRGSLHQEYNVVQNIHMYVHCSIYVQKFCSSEYVFNISPKSMPCSFRYICMYVQNLCSKTYIWPLTDETTVHTWTIQFQLEPFDVGRDMKVNFLLTDHDTSAQFGPQSLALGLPGWGKILDMIWYTHLWISFS